MRAGVRLAVISLGLVGCASEPTVTAQATLTHAHSTATVVPVTARTPTPISTRAADVQPQATLPPGRAPRVTWSETQRGMTAGAFFEPCPPKLGEAITYGVALADASGRPIADANVEITVTGGMGGMVGEHDEDFMLRVPHEEGGVYRARGSLGPSNLVLAGIVIAVRRGGQSWSFVLSSDMASKC